MMKLATCLLNISEARNKEVIRHILHQTKTTIEQESPVGATILNTFCDTDYNRSVISISGQLPQLEQAVTSAVTAALHTTLHPPLSTPLSTPFSTPLSTPLTTLLHSTPLLSHHSAYHSAHHFTTPLH